MDVENIREYCLKKKYVTEDLPFDDETLVFKVAGKMFCLLSLTMPPRMNLKCDPELAVELREKYESVSPGYHMNKNHWNTIKLNNTIPVKILKEWIDNSYNLVYKNISKKQKEELKKK